MPSSVQATFTATVGDTAVLQCPIPPGALLQYYSVEWIKNSIPIAERVNSLDAVSIDRNKYDIDDAYSLVIDSVNMNDSNSIYQCVLYVSNPLTNTKQKVQTFPNSNILLSLIILQGNFIF